MRLNADHHEVILNVAEAHPEIITNKFVGLNSREANNNLWQTLTNNLNSLGYGTLSVAEYKRRLTDWKSKVKAKAVSINGSLQKTGGGEASNLILSQHEPRLLMHMGEKCYKGDNVEEVGFNPKKAKFSTSDDTTLPSTSDLNKSLIPKKLTFIKVSKKSFLPEPIIQTPTESKETNVAELFNDDDNHPKLSIEEVEEIENIMPISTPSRGNKKTAQSASTNRRKNVLNMANSIENMNNDTLKVLHSINENLRGINNNLTSINESIQTIADKFS